VSGPGAGPCGPGPSGRRWSRAGRWLTHGTPRKAPLPATTGRSRTPPGIPTLRQLSARGIHRPGWVYEEKVDGWRVLASKDAAGVRLVSRNGRDLTRRFPELAAAVAALEPSTLLLDVLYALGKDLRARPLRGRRHVLEELVDSHDLVLPSRRLAADGLEAWAQCRLHDALHTHRPRSSRRRHHRDAWCLEVLFTISLLDRDGPCTHPAVCGRLHNSSRGAPGLASRR
jgi:hypothetical protein